MVARLVSADSDSGKLPDVVMSPLNSRYLGRTRPIEDFYAQSDNDDWSLAASRGLTATTAEGTTLLLSRIYPVKSTLALKSGNSIIGKGRATGLAAPSGAPVQVLSGIGLADVTLSNFLIDGGATNAVGDTNYTRAAEIVNSSRITADRLTFQYAADWAFSFKNCNDVTVTNHHHLGGGLANIGGRDGVHFIDCSRVLIDGATLYTGDDCIGITSETKAISDITVRNVRGFSQGAAVVTVGNEGVTAFPATDIVIENISSYTPPEEVGNLGQFLVKVRAQNASDMARITIRNVAGETNTHTVYVEGTTGHLIKDVTIANVRAKSATGTALLVDSCSGLIVTATLLRAVSGIQNGLTVYNSEFVTLAAVEAVDSAMYGIQVHACTDVTLSGSAAKNNGGVNRANNGGGNLRVFGSTNVTILGGTYAGPPATSYFGLTEDGNTNLLILQGARFGGLQGTNVSKYAVAQWVDATYATGWTGDLQYRLTPLGLQFRGTFRRTDNAVFSGSGTAVAFITPSILASVSVIAASPDGGSARVSIGTDKSIAVFEVAGAPTKAQLTVVVPV